VQFVTGADVTGGLPEDLNWAALADPMATTVVFMGKRTFPALAEGLVAHGLPGETPAILAESVGHPNQTLHRSTVAALARSLAEERSAHPALILFGPLAGEMP
jgi:uroporphyrin-III C-methyltransferase